MDRLLVLTDRTQVADGDLVTRVRTLVDAGVTTVVLREKDLGAAERAALARQLVDIVPHLIIASDLAIAAEVGAYGVHLATADPTPDLASPISLRGTTSAATSGESGAVWGRSCHSAAEVARAEDEGTDYVTISPVFASASKPGYGPGLDVDGLAVALGAKPAYALGGIESPERVRAVRTAGAYGVAVMGAAMRASDPVRFIASLLEELE